MASLGSLAPELGCELPALGFQVSPVRHGRPSTQHPARGLHRYPWWTLNHCLLLEWGLFPPLHMAPTTCWVVAARERCLRALGTSLLTGGGLVP